MVHVMFEAQLHVIVPYGFTPSEDGIKAFTLQYNRHMQSSMLGAQLGQLGIDRWKTLASITFNVDASKLAPMTKESARQLSSAITARMQSDAFLRQIDAAMVRGALGT